jgi:hypothetical protein
MKRGTNLEGDLGLQWKFQSSSRKKEPHRVGPSTHDFTESTQLKTVVSSRTQREKSGQREKQSFKLQNETSVGMPWTRRIEREPIQLISSNDKRQTSNDERGRRTRRITVTRRLLERPERGGSKESHLTHFHQKCPGRNGDEARKRARKANERSREKEREPSIQKATAINTRKMDTTVNADGAYEETSKKNKQSAAAAK